MRNFKTNGDLVQFLFDNKIKFSIKNVVDTYINLLPDSLSESQLSTYKLKYQKFACTLIQKWYKSQRIKERFLNSNKFWLQLKCTLVQDLQEGGPCTSRKPDNYSTSIKKSFAQLTDRQKRRKTEEIRKHPVVVSYVAKSSLKSDDAKFVFDFLQSYPEHAFKIRKYCEEISKPESNIVSSQKLLSMYVSAKLTKFQYNVVRDTIKESVSKFPNYHLIQIEKKLCYPNPDSISVSQTFAKINLQTLLDHTSQRFVCMLKDKLSIHKNLIMVSKWGCDGASSQSQYKIPFQNSSDSDLSVLICSFVPLKIYETITNEIVWENNSPSSTRFCRPIQFKFVKESETELKQCIAEIESQINSLIPFKFENTTVNHKFLLTMLDGKVCNILAENDASARCYICKASPKEMNNLEILHNLPKNEEYYTFGLSSLHCWIRSFECLLHISYRLPFKKWSVRDIEDKLMFNHRKKYIQDQFREKMGLLVDVTKQGKGTTNDGNTARKFFANPSVSANITGLDEKLITRFSVILQCIASGKVIELENFKVYTLETAKAYISLYNWYYMPASVHKLLFHSTDIIKNALVPIGQLSEEALEANHKFFRDYRENHSRKFSRESNNRDILNNLLLASDPIISSLRPKLKYKIKELLPEAQTLLVLN